MKNPQKISGRLYIPAILLLCIFFNFFFLQPVLKNGFTGDDWQLLYAYKTFDPDPMGRFLDVWMERGPYTTIQFFYIGILERIFGFHLKAFHTVNIILKIFASITLFYMILKIFKDRLLAGMSAIIFSMIHSSAGALAYVVKGTEYLGIGFMNLFFVVYYYAVIQNSFRLTLLSSAFLFAAFMSSPIRFYPLLALIFLIEFYIVIKKRKIRFFFGSVLRMTLLYIPVLFMIIPTFGFLRIYGSNTENLLTKFKAGIFLDFIMLFKGFGFSLLGNSQLKFIHIPSAVLGAVLLAASFTAFLTWNNKRAGLNKLFLLFFGPFFVFFFLAAIWLVLGGLNISGALHWYLLLPAVGISVFISALILFLYEKWVKSKKIRFLLTTSAVLILTGLISFYEIKGHYSKLLEVGTGAEEQIYMQNEVLNSLDNLQINLLTFFEGPDNPALTQYYAVALNTGYLPNWVHYFKKPQFEGCVAIMIDKQKLLESYNVKEGYFETEGLCSDNRYDLKIKKGIYLTSDFRAFLLKNRKIYNQTKEVLDKLRSREL